jgi:hypothetical protein
VTTYAPDLSTAGIEAGLPTVDVILDGTEGMSGVFAQLAQLVGGYFKFEDGVAYLFTELLGDPCDPIDAAHPFLNDPPVTSSADVSQLRTRVYGKGHGEALLTDVAANESIVPINDSVMFDQAGGRAIAITQRLQYSGKYDGGLGALVGPGVTPSVGPTVTPAAGSGLGLGVYGVAYTFVTVSGETLPSPITYATTHVVSGPTIAPLAQNYRDGNGWGQTGWAIGDTVVFKYTFSSDSTGAAVAETNPSPVSNPVTLIAEPSFPGTFQNVQISGDGSADAAVAYKHLWVSRNGGPFLSCGGALPGRGAWSGFLFGASIGSGTLPAPNANVFNLALTGVALGPSGTTSRKVYRTVVNGAQLKLQQTIAGNTATTGVQDATPDGSLGANAPGTDTSGLTQATGQVQAGAASLITTGVAGWPSAGWALVDGGQVVRYTAKSGNSLTGIPTSGLGALTSTVKYGDHLQLAPALTGVTGNAQPILSGTPINIWVQRDALGDQSDQAAIDVANGRVRADGVYEGPILSDERRGIPSLTALCDATLAIFSRPIQTVRYATRDVNTKSGKPVTVTLASPPITADLVIQEVQISEIDIAPGLAPKFEATASSTRFSLDSLLRKLTKALGV